MFLLDRRNKVYYCEICGAPVKRPVYYEVEGTVMILCESCARYGKKVHQPQKRKTEFKKAIKGRDLIREEIIDWDLVDDYGRKIRNARERLGISQEELSRMIGEPLSYVKKIEKQKIYPSEAVINKLERLLGVKLKSSIIDSSPRKEVQGSRNKSESEIKLGDILVFRKKNKKKSKHK